MNQDTVTHLAVQAMEITLKVSAPFLLAAPDYDVQLLLATQVADEHRHIESLLRVYSEARSPQLVEELLTQGVELSDAMRNGGK